MDSLEGLNGLDVNFGLVRRIWSNRWNLMQLWYDLISFWITSISVRDCKLQSICLLQSINYRCSCCRCCKITNYLFLSFRQPLSSYHQVKTIIIQHPVSATKPEVLMNHSKWIKWIRKIQEWFEVNFNVTNQLMFWISVLNMEHKWNLPSYWPMYSWVNSQKLCLNHTLCDIHCAEYVVWKSSLWH